MTGAEVFRLQQRSDYSVPSADSNTPEAMEGWYRAAHVSVRFFRLDVPKLLQSQPIQTALCELAHQAFKHPVPASLYKRMNEELVTWAAMVVRRPTSQTDLERLFASSTGKSWKAMKAFPDRVRAFATDIDQLHRGELLRGNSEFASLPSILSTYADWLEKQYAYISLRPRRKHRSLYLIQVIPHLSMRVKAFTSRFCDSKVAKLINAVDLALNGERDSNAGFDAQDIADLRCRYKKRKT